MPHLPFLGTIRRMETPKKSFFETYQLFIAVVICGIFIGAGIVVASLVSKTSGSEQAAPVAQSQDQVRKELIKVAKDNGLDQKAFAVCLDSKKNESTINDAVKLAEASGVSGTPTFFIIKNGKQFPILGARDKATYLKAIEEGKAPADQPEQPTGQKIVPTDADHSMGPKDAAVTIVEYSDIDCPFCKRAKPVIDELLAEHPEYRFVYRHSPIVQLHPYAAYKAQASECAFDQGGEAAFWKFLDIVAE